MMKNYIILCKDARRRYRYLDVSNKKVEEAVKEQKRGNIFLFILDDAKRLISNLEMEMKVEASLITDKELLERSKELKDVDKKVKNVGNKITEMLSYSSTERGDEWEVKSIQKRYEDIVALNRLYVLDIKKEVRDKELDTEEIFKESKLNIKLKKFRGYGSSTDVFTFQSQFEKIYKRSTPTRMMPELLKSNFLEDSPLALVKDIDNINEIWERLKKAYGDPKLMINRKMEELQKVGVLWKIKNSEKLIDALQKTVNLMKDLMKLSETHKVENELYYGDGLEKIFKILGDRRLEKWIKENCEKNLSRRESWSSVLKSLEKETTILQQKKIFLGKDEFFKKSDDPPGKSAYLQQSDTPNQSSNIHCSICGEEGHMDTMGPNRSRVIQYFTCKKFVEMTPAQRFHAVWNKGFCIQCLLPGAMADKGKHKDGRCQRDFACKDRSHSKYPRKKHVLLCEEHNYKKENLELLEIYRNRCILRNQNEVPAYSKEIKLSFISVPVTDV